VLLVQPVHDLVEQVECCVSLWRLGADRLQRIEHHILQVIEKVRGVPVGLLVVLQMVIEKGTHTLWRIDLAELLAELMVVDLSGSLDGAGDRLERPARPKRRVAHLLK
jgi:hypothetical protein